MNSTVCKMVNTGSYGMTVGAALASRPGVADLSAGDALHLSLSTSAVKPGNKGLVACQTAYWETHLKDTQSRFAGKSGVYNFLADDLESTSS